MPEPVKCRYPDPDEFPETCPHKYFTEDVDKPFKCQRDGLGCEVECEPEYEVDNRPESETSSEPEV